MNRWTLGPLRVFLLTFFLSSSALAAVKGHIGRAWTDAGYVYVNGWACQEGVNQSIDVHMYAGGAAGQGGTMVAATKANVSNESAVNSTCRTSTARHRFQFRLSKEQFLQHRNKTIYLYGIRANTSARNALLVKSGQIRIPNFSDQRVIGYAGGVSNQTNQILFSGWTCQPNVAKELAVHIYVGGGAGQGVMVGSGRTTVSHERAVTDRCGNTGKRHRYRIAIDKSRLAGHRGKAVYAYGISGVSGYRNRLLNNAGRYTVPNFTRNLRLSQVPKTNGDTVIASDMVVTMDSNHATGLLRIDGKLICPRTGNRVIRATGIIVKGELECGSQDDPIRGKITFRLRGKRNLSMTMNMNGSQMTHDMGIKTFAVVPGGKLRLFGARGKSTWLRLKSTANKNTNVIELTGGVNWQVGDRIAIAPSDFNFEQSEEAVITQRLANNRYKLNRNLTYTHNGANRNYSNGSQSWGLIARAEVANLSRHIVVETEENVRSASIPAADRYIGAHMMVMRGGHAQVDSVEFKDMGQAGIMARYPFHWHRVGNAGGQFIRHSSVHHSFQRCITVHGTNRAWVHNNVCYDHRGHGIFLEDGNEVYNRIANNLVMRSRRAYRGRALLESDYRYYNGDTTKPTTGFKIRRFSPPASYWISNPKNYVYGNVAAGSHGTGFWMSFEDRNLCNPDECSNPARSNTLEFNNNIARAADVGMTWDGARGTESPNNPNNPDDRKLVNVRYSPPNLPTFTGNQVMKTKHAAIYTRSQPMNFSRTVTADTPWHHFHAYNIRIYDSLLVGFGPYQTSYSNYILGAMANAGGHRGVILYDGPFELNRVHFADFSTNRKTTVVNGQTRDITAMPFGAIGGADKFTNRVRGLTFSPEPFRRVDFTAEVNKGWMDWSHSQSILDIDGSLTGDNNAMVVVDKPFNNKSGCVRESGWNALVCPAENYKIGTLLVHNLSGNGSANETLFNTIRNNTLESFPSAPEFGTLNAKVNMIVDGVQSYKVDFEGRSGHRRRLMYHTDRNNEDSPVFQVVNLAQNNCRVDGASAVNSVAAVRNASTSAFYRQGNRLTVKLVPDHQDEKFNRSYRSYRAYRYIMCN